MAALTGRYAEQLRQQAHRLRHLAEETQERALPSCRDIGGERDRLRERAAHADQEAAAAKMSTRRVPRWR